MIKLSRDFNKMWASMAVFLLIAVVILPSLAQVALVSAEKQTSPPPFDTANPPPGTLTMDQLLVLAPPSEERASIEYEEEIDTIEDFALPDEVIAQMSQEELYELLCLPDYITPKQNALNEEAQQPQTPRATNPQPVRTIILIDEEMWTFYCLTSYAPTWGGCCYWADTILENGDNTLESYGIDFQTVQYIYWETPNSLTYSDLLTIIGGIDPRGVGADVIVLMSGQPSGMGTLPNSVVGYSYKGGRHFVMDVTVMGISNAKVFAHEASHLFWCSDHGSNLSDMCIMSYVDMYFTDRHCSSACYNTIQANKFKFDHSFALTASGQPYGSGTVAYASNLEGSWPDGYYAEIRGLTSGAGGNIVGQLDKSAYNCDIWIYAMSGATNTRLYTYISSSGNGGWVETKSQIVPYSATPQWIYCGKYSYGFQYVSIAALYENGWSANIYIDSALGHKCFSL
jgi:hypothetical protein